MPALVAAEKGIQYHIGFGQSLNSYQWNTNFSFQKRIQGSALLTVAEDFNSSLIRLGSEDNKWKDDQKLRMGLLYPISPTLALKFSAQANQFTDKLSGFVSDIRTNSALAGLVAKPLNKVEISSSAGYKYDSRLNKKDRGFTYQLDITTDTLNLNDYQNQFLLSSNSDRYQQRRNNDFLFRYRVKKHFQQDTYDSLTFYWTKKRRDNYDRLGLDAFFIESLTEEIRGVSHYLSYGSRDGIRFEVKTVLNSRQTSVSKFSETTLVDERSKKEFDSENQAGIHWRHQRFKLNLALAFMTDNQKNQVPDSVKSSRFSRYFYYISPDFESSRFVLSGYSQINFGKNDTLVMRGAVSRFQYDTPENNVDDRDEFRMNFQISAIHHFTPSLKMIINSSVNLYHLVYIYKERSANNNWMRIFRLYPQIVYRPNRKFELTQTTEVLANYVDYDYDTGSSLTDIRSYVFRRFAMEHLLNAYFSDMMGISFSYKFEIEENGKLNWDRWTEILLTNRVNHWVRFNLNYQFKEKWYLSPGIIVFQRKERHQDLFSLQRATSSQSGDWLSYGPTLRIIYRPHERLNLSFEGVRRVVETPNKPASFIDFINLKLMWYR